MLTSWKFGSCSCAGASYLTPSAFPENQGLHRPSVAPWDRAVCWCVASPRVLEAQTLEALKMESFCVSYLTPPPTGVDAFYLLLDPSSLASWMSGYWTHTNGSCL